MNRSRPRTYQFSQPFIRVSQYEEFAKLDNSSIQDASQNNQQLNSQQNQVIPENNENSNNNIITNQNSQPFPPDVSAQGKINSSNPENTITPSASNPSNNSAIGNNSSASIFTTFSGPGQSSLYHKIAFGANTSSSGFADKGANAENPEKKRKIQGYSYIRLRHDQNLPKPEAYELRNDDINFLNQFNKNFSQNLIQENPSKYEEILNQQKLRHEEGADGNSAAGGDESNGKSFQNNNDGTIILITEEQLERLFIHFEKKSTKDTTATFQEVKMELPKEYEVLSSAQLDEIYQYWKREREREYERQGEKNTEKQKELYPFMRKYWRASTEDLSAHAAFRPRETNRMRTRKSARPENKETYEKMLSLEGDFKKYRLLALNLKKRELLKREIAYIQITDFNKSIPGLSNEFQIYNKFTSREQEIKQISNLIQPKLPKQVKSSKSKAQKGDYANKEQATNQNKEANEEIMNADDSNVISAPEVTKKGIKISLPKLSIELEKKSKFSDEAKKVQANGELAEAEDASSLAKPLDDAGQIPNETKKKKKATKKKAEQQVAESADKEGEIQLEKQVTTEQEPVTVPIKKSKKKKQSEDQKKGENGSTLITLPPLEDSQAQQFSVNGNIDNVMQNEDEKPPEPEVTEKKKKSKKEKGDRTEKKLKDPKDKTSRKKKKQSEEVKNDEESVKPDDTNQQGQSPILNKFDSQSNNPEIDQSAIEKFSKQESIQVTTTQKKQPKRIRKQKIPDPIVDPETNITGNISEMVDEVSNKLASVPLPSLQIQQSNIPLIKLDKDQETAQFLSSFIIYFHQFKLPINVENVESSDKIASKNLEMQEEKKQKLKNPNTLAYLIRKRIGRSNRNYIDRTFDSMNEIIGIQSGKISYLLSPHHNEVIYNTFNYVNPDAIKTLSSTSYINSNNPFSSSSNPLSSSNISSLISNSSNSTAATGISYDEDTSYNKRESKSVSDKKLKILPGNEKLISEVREKQRQLFRSSLFQQKQEKIKSVIQQPYIQEMERRRKRTHHQAFFLNSRAHQLWIEDDDNSDHDDIFQKSIVNLKQTIEEKQKEKEKRLKQQQKALAEQLKKQREAEQKEEQARLLQQQKEEALKQQELQQQRQQQLQPPQPQIIVQPSPPQPLQQQQQQQLPLPQLQQPIPYNNQQLIPPLYNNNANNNFNMNNNLNNNNNSGNINSNTNLSNQYYQDQPYLYEQNSTQNFNQPQLQHNQSSMSFYNNFERNSFDQVPSNMYGPNNQIMNQQGLDNMMNMNEDYFSPMQIGQRQHQSSFQGGDIPQLSSVQGLQSQPNLNQQQSNNFQDVNYSYFEQDENMNPMYDTEFNNQPNLENNNFQYYQNNDFMQNDGMENNYLAGENNINPQFMDDDL